MIMTRFTQVSVFESAYERPELPFDRIRGTSRVRGKHLRTMARTSEA
jgi:hypothetical protein